MAGKSNTYKPDIGNEAPAINEGEGPVVLKLTIPLDLYAEYEGLASKQGLTVAELVLHRLRRCKDHNSLRPLYFTDTQRAQLETILQKRPLELSEQALTLLTTMLSLRVGELPPIQLTAQQIKRIQMGGYAGQTPEQRLAGIVQGAISKAYGI